MASDRSLGCVFIMCTVAVHSVQYGFSQSVSLGFKLIVVQYIILLPYWLEPPPVVVITECVYTIGGGIY